ncbi:YfiR family protein [Burkholderia multivorans]|uniref:DUF4154 domain-containing protein n=1 Tax=Burkholderia multivorans TaxID=87883 RepID=A0A2S9N0B9_9BURK|nr:YfiR family protein [Burkholderia multivorans]MBR7892235.1 YfiR family protein [Burkholderia multivorans]MBU9512775.1 YfiR family protein [Burkholderia multivorans]MBU9524442.1 YfiR family protein [Burkholderia multivorans]MBU9536177.1 YfiR family protein [Burkholderia multivorans]MBU9634039.1 YfiR family protein [Burkholderia multivorans]
MVATVCAPVADCPTAPAPTSAAATAARTTFGRCGRAASLRHVLLAVTCALGAVPAALAGFAAYAGAPDEAARIAAAPPASAAEAEAALPPHDAAVRRVVLGIVSFTRWPTQPARLRLCIVGRPDYAGGLIDTLQAGATPLDVQRIRFDDRALGSACDVVYLGMLSDDERAQVRRAVAGHPVLTIAEHDPSCIAGGMFCLNVDGEPVTFDINLDAVARSGVRVHPNVLNLARRPVTP